MNVVDSVGVFRIFYASSVMCERGLEQGEWQFMVEASRNLGEILVQEVLLHHKYAILREIKAIQCCHVCSAAHAPFKFAIFVG